MTKIDDWINQEQGKHFCKCGCNGEIIIKAHHHSKGIPKFISGHSSRGRKRFDLSERNKNNIMCGENNHFYNKHHTEENKLKHSNLMKGRYIGENNPNSKEKIKKICKCCKIEFEIPPYLNDLREYCSRKCSSTGEHNPAWKGGISYLPYCELFNNKKREEIRDKYNRKCYICNKDESKNITKSGNKWRLSVHHIDLDKEQGCNNKGWKLIPVCMKCHRKIHNNKIKI